VLWNVAVKDADLLAELKLVKDLLLLGRGEIVSEFIKLANPILKDPPQASRLRGSQSYNIFFIHNSFSTSDLLPILC
jgi:hypothetical protein